MQGEPDGRGGPGRQVDPPGGDEGLHRPDHFGHGVVQVYLHDRAAEVVRPVQALIAARRVDLAAGSAATVRFTLHADLTSFTGRDGARIVEPGEVELRVGASSADVREVLPFTLTGSRRTVAFDRRLHPGSVVEQSAS